MIAVAVKCTSIGDIRFFEGPRERPIVSVPLEPLQSAVLQRDMRLAVFDVALRRQTGQWRLEHRIGLAETIDRFAEIEIFVDDDGNVRVPLHQPDEPALTNEFLLVDPSVDSRPVTVYDIGRRDRHTMPLEEIEWAYPAWRTRFWTESFTPDEPAPFLAEFGTPDPTEANPDPVEPTPSTPPADTIVETARSELSSRRSAERQRRRTAFERLPVPEFIEQYGGVQNAVTCGRETDDFGQQSVIIELPAEHPLAAEPDLSLATNIRSGDVVIIDTDQAPGFPVEAEVFAIENGRFELGVYWDTAAESGAEAAFDGERSTSVSLGILVEGNRYAAIDAALGTVERTDHALSRYAGQASLTFAADMEQTTPDVDLNRDQRTAAERALATEALAIVRTPPGTGARRVLWTVIRETVEDGGRVCVLAPDRRAIDRLIVDAGDPSIADRAAAADMALHRCQPNAPPPVGADIVAAPITLANQIDDHEYDLAILDQAGRISVPGGAVPFAKAGRVVVCGDPMQSPPSPLDQTIDDVIAPSIYEHLVAAYGEPAVATLRCQYRMSQAIALFPNRQFYDDQLIHGQRNREWRFDATSPLVGYQIPSSVRETPTGSAYNDDAVTAVIEEVDRLRERGVSAAEIGVLTPSSAEMGKIRAALQEIDEAVAEAVTVGGLDRFRCDARDAMIVSFIRHGDEVAPFWTEPGLALALTRARKRLVLLGDWERIGEEKPDHPAGQLATFLEDRGLIDMFA